MPVIDIHEHIILKRGIPNPFNGTQTIEFALPTTTSVLLTIHDGRTRRDTLLEGSFPAGVHQVVWTDDGFVPGIYRVFIETPEWSCYGDIDLRP